MTSSPGGGATGDAREGRRGGRRFPPSPGSLLRPAPRRRGGELLDDPALADGIRLRASGDLRRSNAWFGGARAVLRELARELSRERGGEISVLDVGTGLGDIPARARRAGRRRGVALRTIGVDAHFVLARAARDDGMETVCADAVALPFADGGVDLAVCSQLLHHFEHRQAIALLRELHRVARRRVIVSDLRRSRLAAVALWLASFPLRFHPVSRHDGVVSVLRGFTARELSVLVHAAVGSRPDVRVHPGFRLTASWTPSSAPRSRPPAIPRSGT